MTIRRILLANAVVWLTAAAAAAGTLDFWEDSLGAQDVTAFFPTGTAQTAHIVFDADSAEGGGLWDGATGILIEPAGSMVFTAFSCAFHPCSQGNDYLFTPGGAGTGFVRIDDGESYGETHDVHPIGTITFDGPVEPGSMPLVKCSYTGLDFEEYSCSPFVLVQLPEPMGTAALIPGAALLFGLRRRRTHRTRVSRRSFA